jgi:hypothetical protein
MKHKHSGRNFALAMLSAALSAAAPALAQDHAAALNEIAKKSLNPVADLASLPFQYNYDEKMGSTGTGKKAVLNIQPVIPFSLNQEWNIISRTIVPLIDQKGMAPNGAADASGLGDIAQNVYFSPKKPTAGGWIWGAGPVFLLPTASDDLLGSKKWGLGPTAVVLKQADGWTYGALANHIWSVAGDSNRQDINATYLQPFIAYTTKTHTSIALNTESTYDWKTQEWSVPLNLAVTQMFKIGQQIMSFQVGVRHWASSPPNGPGGTGYRAQLIFLFPK